MQYGTEETDCMQHAERQKADVQFRRAREDLVTMLENYRVVSILY